MKNRLNNLRFTSVDQPSVFNASVDEEKLGKLRMVLAA